MELSQAEKIANEVASRLAPYCEKLEVVGSIRRRKPLVNDIDIILIVSDPLGLSREISALGPVQAWGSKLKQVIYKGVQVDLYDSRRESWGTLLLIRTGSKDNNIRLATLAKQKSWHLAASGDGLFDETGKRIAGDTEESIYAALGAPYVEPELR